MRGEAINENKFGDNWMIKVLGILISLSLRLINFSCPILHFLISCNWENALYLKKFLSLSAFFLCFDVCFLFHFLLTLMFSKSHPCRSLSIKPGRRCQDQPTYCSWTGLILTGVGAGENDGWLPGHVRHKSTADKELNSD
ncbi:Hypothetical predicted protein [Olea europaea subsp. europaea]|uniref:Uncharacterized protein n=1 Tax=Olea europaea subsp. europaea TaxID=158383 RepID=A0A8S0SL82_OLEEU|nr:Hypothetical predicted protein [Olea europaea subsp. europaea]